MYGLIIQGVFMDDTPEAKKIQETISFKDEAYQSPHNEGKDERRVDIEQHMQIMKLID